MNKLVVVVALQIARLSPTIIFSAFRGWQSQCGSCWRRQRIIPENSFFNILSHQILLPPQPLTPTNQPVGPTTMSSFTSKKEKWHFCLTLQKKNCTPFAYACFPLLAPWDDDIRRRHATTTCVRFMKNQVGWTLLWLYIQFHLGHFKFVLAVSRKWDSCS